MARALFTPDIESAVGFAALLFVDKAPTTNAEVVRTVLEASGALREIRRLTAVLEASQATQECLKASLDKTEKELLAAYDALAKVNGRVA